MAYLDWFPRAARNIAVALFTFFEVITAFANAAWRHVDVPACLTTALDEMARAHATVSAKASAFREFSSRALKHDHYTAGHFDPGRMPA